MHALCKPYLLDIGIDVNHRTHLDDYTYERIEVS